MYGIQPVRRRLLGAALRRYRENVGYTMDDAARLLECDRSKLSRIETGQRGIRLRELRELLAEYGAGEDESRALQEIADPRAARGWWQEYGGVLPEPFRDYLVLEAAATQVLVYDCQQVPALLQTGEYARAVARAEPAVPAAAQDQIVQAVLARQMAILTGGYPEVMVIIGEGALHQQAGGAAVMRAQLGRLAEIAETSAQVTIQVLPFTAGAHVVGTGPAAVLGFGKAAGLGIVHLASLSGGVFLDDPGDVACYVQAFMRLQVSALSPAESSNLLRQLARS